MLIPVDFFKSNSFYDFTKRSSKLVVYYNQIPPVPIPLNPLNNSSIYNVQPIIRWSAGTDLDGDIVCYNFEVDTTPTFTSPAKITYSNADYMDATIGGIYSESNLEIVKWNGIMWS